jgi:hypothetical protein
VVRKMFFIPNSASVLLLGNLISLIYEIPVEIEDLLDRILCVKLFRTRQVSLIGYARTWCIATMSAMESMEATSKSFCELTENDAIKNSTCNVEQKQ